ncbi:CRISPR-associated helicase Cas3' [Hyperthermus butylicus]|uniref:Helicase n=1 Tax=Hyperthermus butylicus (strain DSM 5456 / JCM 9403 / PLM1-5) TaxID=415426 RepID=A2BKI6_HYPBU|nr:CRISPR-associated helicase Cas3' [Hyperthermus butylicus]ABM80497.1 putative helicase [Hyperthermus butylicus DSM 5456]
MPGLSLDPEGYSPFMLRRAVVSTLDSFALNLARLPVAELSLVLTGYEMRRLEGHYELPRASILTSLVVFDEAHLYAEPWLEGETPFSRLYLSTVLPILRDTRTPVVVETATMSTKLTESIAATTGATVLAVCRSCNRCGKGWKCIPDTAFEEENMFDWKTVILKTSSEAIRLAVDHAEAGRKVLYAVNTVGSALKTYRELRAMLGEENVVLVHGRLAQRDREEAIKKIERAKVVVATQVVEAGVDVDAEVLVTEAAAPSSLAQRAGRLCRSQRTAEKCRSDPPIVAIYVPNTLHPYGSIAVETVKTVKQLVEARRVGIEWRLLDDNGGRKSFRHLVEAHEAVGLEVEQPRAKLLAYRRLLANVVASALGDPRPARMLIEQFCSLVRGTALVHLAAPLNEGYDFLEAPLDWLRARGRWKSLLNCSNGICNVIGIGYAGEEPEVVEAQAPARDVEAMLANCSSYLRTYYKLLENLSKDTGARLHTIALALREDAYTPGIGLKTL